MKTIVPVIIGIIAFIAVFYFDGKIIDAIIGIIPKSASDWYSLIRIGLWVFAIAWTTGLAMFFAVIAGAISAYFFSK